MNVNKSYPPILISIINNHMVHVAALIFSRLIVPLENVLIKVEKIELKLYV